MGGKKKYQKIDDNGELVIEWKKEKSIKVLRKASGVNVKEFCKSIHMTERSYYSALKSKLTI